MRKFVVVMTIIILVPGIAYCAQPEEAVKGTGKGVVDVVEGAGRGVTELGTGAVGCVGGTTKAAGYALVGHGEESVESGEEAVESGKKGVTGVITEPLDGLGRALQDIDEGIKKATGSAETE